LATSIALASSGATIMAATPGARRADHMEID
jgi:hypothetical protein